MSAEVARILRDAADLIEPPGRWTRGAYARNEAGDGVSCLSGAAVCWCVVGTLLRGTGRHEDWLEALDVLGKQAGILPGVDSVVGWNDAQLSVEPVVAALRAAADAVEAEEART